VSDLGMHRTRLEEKLEETVIEAFSKAGSVPAMSGGVVMGRARCMHVRLPARDQNASGHTKPPAPGDATIRDPPITKHQPAGLCYTFQKAPL
jgi:hypothetical protein